MCCVAAKYIDKFGWVLAKNRDRNYTCSIDIIRDTVDGIQRVLIDDKLTRWQEGVNEFGVAIVSASFSVKFDEKEGDKVKTKSTKKAMVSPDGRAIRKALREKNPKDAIDILVEYRLAGATYVANEDECYLLEGGFNITKEKAKENKEERKYLYKIQKISKSIGYSVRTNHGVLVKGLGYNKGSDERRKSSESRLKAIEDAIEDTTFTSPNDLLSCMSVKPHEDPFMNPVRLGDIKKGDMVTTGQLLLIPKERSLHYRPIYSAVSFDYSRLNDTEKNRVFFEIVSDRKMLSFSDFRKKL